MIQPPFLIPGDGLSIVSPASIINPDYVKGAVERLESWPVGVSVSLHCLGRSGVYSGTVEERLDRIEQLLRGQKNVLNFSEACDFTGISPSYMYKLTHNARIPHYKPHGKNVYFLREELEQWLLQNPVRTAEQKDREATEFVLRKRRPR